MPDYKRRLVENGAFENRNEENDSIFSPLTTKSVLESYRSNKNSYSYEVERQSEEKETDDE